MKPLTRLLRQLEGIAVRQKSQVDALQAEQRELRLAASVAALPCRQLDALVDLAAAVAARRAQRCGAERFGAPGAGPLETVVRPEPQPGNGEFWRAQIEQLSSQLGGPCGAEAAAAAPGGKAAALPACLSAPALGWSPAAAAEWLFSEEDPPQLTTEGFRDVLRDFAVAGAQLMPRIQNGAPDADSALARLQTAGRRTLEMIALLAIGEGRGGRSNDVCGATGCGGGSLPSGLSSATGAGGSGSFSGSATGAGVGGGGGGAPGATGGGSMSFSSGGGRGAAGGKRGLSPLVAVVLTPLDGSDAPLPDETWWMWAVEQVSLDPQQEEVLLLLMERWRARSQAVNQRCLTLHAEVEARAGMDAAAHDDLLRELAAAQLTFELNSAVFALAVYGSVLRPQQMAEMVVASWPFAPTLHMLHQVLDLRSERRKQAAAAAAAEAAAAGAAEAAEAPAAGQGRGGRRGRAPKGRRRGWGGLI